MKILKRSHTFLCINRFNKPHYLVHSQLWHHIFRQAQICFSRNSKNSVDFKLIWKFSISSHLVDINLFSKKFPLPSFNPIPSCKSDILKWFNYTQFKIVKPKYTGFRTEIWLLTWADVVKMIIKLIIRFQIELKPLNNNGIFYNGNLRQHLWHIFPFFGSFCLRNYYSEFHDIRQLKVSGLPRQWIENVWIESMTI